MHIHEHLQVQMLWDERRKRQESKLILESQGRGMSEFAYFPLENLYELLLLSRVLKRKAQKSNIEKVLYHLIISWKCKNQGFLMCPELDNHHHHR